MHEIFDMPFFVCQGKPHVTLLSHLQVPVPLLKEKIATVTGILSEQQRLICRGRVLKDDELLSAYRILTYLVVPSSILFFFCLCCEIFLLHLQIALCISSADDINHSKY